MSKTTNNSTGTFMSTHKRPKLNKVPSKCSNCANRTINRSVYYCTPRDIINPDKTTCKFYSKSEYPMKKLPKRRNNKPYDRSPNTVEPKN